MRVATSARALADVTPPAEVCGEAQALTADLSVSPVVSPHCLSICFGNLQGLLSHRIELETRLQRECPHLVCIQEAWLNEDEIQIAGYRVVARKDRLKGPKIGYGGVLVLARDDVEFFEELQCDCDGEFHWALYIRPSAPC